jgi:hypothetical protein
MKPALESKGFLQIGQILCASGVLMMSCRHCRSNVCPQSRRTGSRNGAKQIEHSYIVESLVKNMVKINIIIVCGDKK